MNAPADPERKDPLGVTAFETLRAEDEPWLSRCFVEPPEFDRLMGDRSIVVYGGTGCGKTAVCQELLTRSKNPEGKPMRLLVDWRPAPVSASLAADSSWVYRQATQILDVCAVTLARHLLQYPDDFSNAPGWAQTRLIWFIHRFTHGSAALRLGPLMETSSAGTALLQDILNTPPTEVLYEDAAPEQAVTELADALNPMGLKGVWVITDGLEGWVETDRERLVLGLKAFLSTLSLFERSRLAFKLFLPSRLEPALSGASGLLRRRVDAYHLRWDASSLRRLVEARLALATGSVQFKLQELCGAPDLMRWLETVGAGSPREWLDQVRPLVEIHRSQGLSEPVDEETWDTIRRQHPPHLYLDETGRRVVVGGREISLEDVPTKAYDMLRYLYERGGQVVTKGELYFRAYRGLETFPRSPADKDYEAPKDYEGLIDTNLWRLRKAIEPDPKNPVLLVTIRGHGVRLAVRW